MGTGLEAEGLVGSFSPRSELDEVMTELDALLDELTPLSDRITPIVPFPAWPADTSDLESRLPRMDGVEVHDKPTLRVVLADLKGLFQGDDAVLGPRVAITVLPMIRVEASGLKYVGMTVSRYSS